MSEFITGVFVGAIGALAILSFLLNEDPTRKDDNKYVGRDDRTR